MTKKLAEKRAVRISCLLYPNNRAFDRDQHVRGGPRDQSTDLFELTPSLIVTAGCTGLPDRQLHEHLPAECCDSRIGGKHFAAFDVLRGQDRLCCRAGAGREDNPKVL